MYDVVIIGGGPGGYTAALYCARAALKTLVLEKFAPGGQMGTTDQIDNYPGFPEGINGFELAMQMQQGAERFGAETRLAEVLSVSLDGAVKKVETTEGTVEAKTVILATGSHPRELGVDREKALRGRGISYCATCDGMFYRNKTVAVVGGGNTAVSDVLYLANICEKVYLIHRRDTLRASKVYSVPLQALKNVEILYDSQVVEIQGENNVAGVLVENKNTGGQTSLSVNGLFVAVGNLPNSQLYKGQLELDESGYIVADESTRTSISGVFAIGDLRTKPLRQIITAAGDGAVASYYAEEYLSTQEIKA